MLSDDIRFNPATNKAYLTDAGLPGLIILDLETGESVRVLDDQPSTTGFMPVSAEGEILYMAGEPVYLYADQMEVSPDGKYFYYEPASGGMSRITTKLLDEAFEKFPNGSFNKTPYLNAYVEPFALTPSTGGTAIDADGNIYNSDTDSLRIIKITPNGKKTTLVQDPRLLWIDAMWITADGKLWMPAAQLNRGYPFNHGVSVIDKPLYIYSIDIGIGPSPIDHD